MVYTVDKSKNKAGPSTVKTRFNNLSVRQAISESLRTTCIMSPGWHRRQNFNTRINAVVIYALERMPSDQLNDAMSSKHSTLRKVSKA